MDKKPAHEQFIENARESLMAFGLAGAVAHGRGLTAVNEISNDADVVYMPIANIAPDSDPDLLAALLTYDTKTEVVVAVPRVPEGTPYVVKLTKGEPHGE